MIKTTLLLLGLAIVFSNCKKDKHSDAPLKPIAWYKMNGNGYNSAYDGLHATDQGSTYISKDSFDVPSSAFEFDTESWLKVADNDTLDFKGNQFTIAVWVKPYINANCYIVNKAASSGAGGPYTLDFYPGVVRAFVRTNTDDTYIVEGTTKIVKSVWQHIAVTYTGEQLTVYYNGKAEASKPTNGKLIASTGALGIGASPFYFPNVAYDGKMDNVLIYDKALNADQVLNLYKNYNQ